MTRDYKAESAWFSLPLSLRGLVGILMFVATIGVCGCGPRGPVVVRVTGTVTHQGKPVPNLVLNFKPEEGRPSWGITDAEGKYFLEYNRDRKGAVVGKHTVWVRFRPSSPSQEMQKKRARRPFRSLKKIW